LDLPKPQFSKALAAEIRAAGEAVRSPTTSINAASAASAWRRASVEMAGLSMAALGAAPTLASGIDSPAAFAFSFRGGLLAMTRWNGAARWGRRGSLYLAIFTLTKQSGGIRFASIEGSEPPWII
jgi:hypothetical protein